MATIRVLGVAACALLIAGCGSDGGEAASGVPSAQQQPPQAAPVSPPSTPTNSAPTVQGQPVTAVMAGDEYSFRVTASDADGNALIFSAANLPAWARLNSVTGEITGSPMESDAGTYAGVTLSVSDGAASASLAPFSITVENPSPISDGRATLSWSPPTENTDGSALTDLASYRILYGRNPSDLSKAVHVANPSVTNYVIEDLAAGQWYFSVVAVNTKGVSSTPSNISSKKIS
ncbi:MAG: putative Ig domain-containing protein [Povalibacter sp.]